MGKKRATCLRNITHPSLTWSVFLQVEENNNNNPSIGRHGALNCFLATYNRYSGYLAGTPAIWLGTSSIWLGTWLRAPLSDVERAPSYPE